MFMAIKKTAKKAAKSVTKMVRSDAAKAYMQHMAEYEALNPTKFATKKAEMEAKLATL